MTKTGSLNYPNSILFCPIAVSATDYPPRSSRQGRGRSRGISFMLIGITQPSGKLVFVASLQVSCHCETSALKWRGNPPVRAEMFRKLPRRLRLSSIFGGNRYRVPFNRGIATPVCALARNDSKERSNTNLSHA